MLLSVLKTVVLLNTFVEIVMHLLGFFDEQKVLKNINYLK